MKWNKRNFLLRVISFIGLLFIFFAVLVRGWLPPVFVYTVAASYVVLLIILKLFERQVGAPQQSLTTTELALFAIVLIGMFIDNIIVMTIGIILSLTVSSIHLSNEWLRWNNHDRHRFV